MFCLDLNPEMVYRYSCRFHLCIVVLSALALLLHIYITHKFNYRGRRNHGGKKELQGLAQGET